MNLPEGLAAIVLCGGNSIRMGRAKATLPFGDRTMLERVIERLREACDPIVVVAARDQELPHLTEDILMAQDQRPERGPLEGLIAGLNTLRRLPHPPAAAFATSCDVPRLCPQWPLALAQRLGRAAAAVPRDDQYHHPLAAVYRLDVLANLQELGQRNELRPRRLFDLVETVRVPVEELRSCDPELATLQNLNTPEQYLSALVQEGLDCPENLRQAWNLST